MCEFTAIVKLVSDSTMKLTSCLSSSCKLPSHVVIIICSLFVQFVNITRAQYLVCYTHRQSRVIIFTLLGIIYFSYPFLGYLADVKFTRYRILIFSFCLLLIGEATGLLLTVVDTTIDAVFDSNALFIIHLEGRLALVLVLIAGIVHIVGMGFFEANVIQFGLDQLLEAPTQQLSAFIHWYYWSQNVGHLMTFYAVLIWFLIDKCTVEHILHEKYYLLGFIFLIIICVLIILACLILLSIYRKRFYIQRPGLNPFKNLYKVLKYSWKHKVPQRRSAFTYWEEDIPPRIDLGKNKYGGPFTTEEVEDTKTFLRILPLLLCLFGYHLAGDGYSAPQQLQRTSCPSLPVLLLIIANPLHMSALVAVLGIPLYRLVIIKIVPWFKHIFMLTSMWMGLYLSLLQVILYIIVVINHDITYWQQHRSDLIVSDAFLNYTTIKKCHEVRVGVFLNGSCQTGNDPVDNTYLWFIVPQLLNGLSSLLVSMTVFEFICAQAPRTTQGLLIGLWYATFSIRYLVVDVLDSYITERNPWLICEGVKGFLILVSLVLFSCLSRHYHYRQRDEIVNVQAMIEDTHEKWLDQEEEYMQERRALLGNLSANNLIANNPYSVQ